MGWKMRSQQSIIDLRGPVTVVILSLLLSSCDGGQTDRRKVKLGNPPADSTYRQGNSYGFNSEANGGNTTVSSTGTNSGTSGGGNTSGGSGSATSSLPAEFANCQFPSGGFSHYHALIGDFNICKSTASGTSKVLLQTKNTINDFRVCVYPTNDDAGDGSVMIGGSRCLFTTSQQMNTLEFTINRQGFTERRLTGVIIVKDMPYGEVTPYHNDMVHNPPTYATAYEDCMNYIFNTGDSFACQRFKDKGNYVYVSL